MLGSDCWCAWELPVMGDFVVWRESAAEMCEKETD